MKLIKSKLIQASKGKKKGKYLATFEITDYDIEMLENFTMTTAPYKLFDKPELHKYIELKPKYKRFQDKLWYEFWKLWKKYD